MSGIAAAAGGMTVQQFQQKWRGITLKERQASQPHFIDLCRMLGVSTPTDADPDRHLLHLRARRGEERRRSGLGRRLVARQLRLGVQGPSRRT